MIVIMTIICHYANLIVIIIVIDAIMGDAHDIIFAKTEFRAFNLAIFNNNIRVTNIDNITTTTNMTKSYTLTLCWPLRGGQATHLAV